MQISDGLSLTMESFSRSPFRLPTFIASSVLFVGAVSLGIYVLAEHWARLRGNTCSWLILVIVALVGFWIRSIVEYQRMRQLLERGGISEFPSDSSFKGAMRIAERMFNFGLFFTFFLSWALLAQILTILQQR
jgi:hypothetical protein